MRNDYLILVSKLMGGLAWLTRHAGRDWSMWLMTNTLSPLICTSICIYSNHKVESEYQCDARDTHWLKSRTRPTFSRREH